MKHQIPLAALSKTSIIFHVLSWYFAGPPPSIDNLPGSVEIYENGVDVAILDIIFIVTASHQNNYPGNSNTWEPVAITYSMDPTYAAEFQIDPLTGGLQVPSLLHIIIIFL